MAGATNRALKAAGLPKATIATIRVQGSRGVSLQSAIKIATKAGAHVPDKAHAHLARRTEAHAKLERDFKAEMAKPNPSDKRLDSIFKRLEAAKPVAQRLVRNDATSKAQPAPRQEAPKVAPKAPHVAANATAGERAVASAKHAVAVARVAAEGKDKYHPAVAKLNKAEKALRAAYEQQDAEPSRSNPAADRMQASKANVATLRAQRDARRENMQRMRKRAEFSRETKQLRAAFTPEHQRAIDKAEMGHGPKHAKSAARASLLEAKASVRDARKAVEAAHNSIKFGQEAAMMSKPNSPGAELGVRARQFLRDAATARQHLAPANDHLARANMARTAARQQRRHATLVNEGRALREMADADHPLTRRGAKADFGFTGVSRPVSRSTIGHYNGTFNSARHLEKRLALGEKLAQRVLGGKAEKANKQFMRNLDAIKRLAPKKSVDPKVNARNRMRAEYDNYRK